MAIVIAGTIAGVGAVSSYYSAKAQNDAIKQANARAKARYAFQSRIAENIQLDQDIALRSNLTQSSLSMINAREQYLNTAQAGNTQQRALSTLRTKATQQKEQVIQSTINGKINATNDMFAKHMDLTETLGSLTSQKKNVFFSTLQGGLGGAVTGFTLANAVNGMNSGSTGKAPSTSGSTYGI